MRGDRLISALIFAFFTLSGFFWIACSPTARPPKEPVFNRGGGESNSNKNPDSINTPAVLEPAPADGPSLFGIRPQLSLAAMTKIDLPAFDDQGSRFVIEALHVNDDLLLLQVFSAFSMNKENKQLSAIYLSFDEGKNFSLVRAKDLEGCAAQDAVYSLGVAGAMPFIACGSNAVKTTFVSIDRGQTWKRLLDERGQTIRADSVITDTISKKVVVRGSMATGGSVSFYLFDPNSATTTKIEPKNQKCIPGPGSDPFFASSRLLYKLDDSRDEALKKSPQLASLDLASQNCEFLRTSGINPQTPPFHRYSTQFVALNQDLYWYGTAGFGAEATRCPLYKAPLRSSSAASSSFDVASFEDLTKTQNLLPISWEKVASVAHIEAIGDLVFMVARVSSNEGSFLNSAVLFVSSDSGRSFKLALNQTSAGWGFKWGSPPLARAMGFTSNKVFLSGISVADKYEKSAVFVAPLSEIRQQLR